ncbi:hypothetical protein MHTCC0001_34720 [Flavobacteriaceae bacterium MHTCC 0001]
MENWTNSSKLTTDLESEICYQISNSFFIGNPNDPNQFQNTDLNVAIKLPQIDRKVKEIVTTKEVFGNEVQLSEYYKSIIELKEKHNKSYREVHHLFWLRLWILNSKEKIYISFPWYDTINEFKRFFRIFDENKTGQIFYDIDQGWQLEILADNHFYYIRQTNPDDSDLIIQNIKTDKVSLKNSIKKLEENINSQIEKLTNLIGIDLWTDREYLKEAINTKSFGEIDVENRNRNQIKNVNKISKKPKRKRIKKITNTFAWIILFVTTTLMQRKLISWIIPAIILGYILIVSIIDNNKNDLN